MKKIIFSLIVFSLIWLPGLFLGQTAQAAPIQDYDQVLPTVKLDAYKLARNGDLYLALSGSATIISPEGHLLTNSHVVLDERDDPYDVFAVCLSFNENEEPRCDYSASLLGYDQNLDAALLKLAKINGRGGVLPLLPYLDAGYQGEVAIGQPLTILGYSDIGGKTLTSTKGQVSGWEEYNGLNYIKTDTDISGGNSGGTALDENGNFIGVPTYLISSYENLGYVLNIQDAQQFIAQYWSATPPVNAAAEELLRAKLNLLNQTKDSHHYQHPYYPRFSLTAGADWQWEEIERSSVSLLWQSGEGDKNININIEVVPYKVTDEHLTEILRLAGLYQDYLSNYQQTEVMFAGSPATLITFNSPDQKHFAYFIPYGASIITISYAADLDKLAEDLRAFDQVVATFTFIDQPIDQPPVLASLVRSDPAFSIGRSGPWFIQNNQKPYLADTMAYWFNSAADFGQMSISYYEMSEDDKLLSNEQMSDQLSLSLQNEKIINTNPLVIVDGLPGWSITYITEGREAEQLEKVSRVYLRAGDYLYEIVYEDLVDSYDQNLEHFKTILKSFKNNNPLAPVAGKGEYQLGSLDYLFSDITYHRFEQAITSLANQGVVLGYADNSFRPEKKITAGEARQYLKNSFAQSKRSETDQLAANFLSGDQVFLADGLKAMFDSYRLNIWQDTFGDAPAGKPYLDKGLSIGLLPIDLLDLQHPLTRAEFAYLLNSLLDSFEVL